MTSKTINTKKALVIFSGGQDSTTCLHWAKQKFSQVQAVFFNYQQRHLNAEQTSALKIANLNNISLKLLTLDTFSQMSENSLLNHQMDIQQTKNQLPNTFVPGRNLIFLTYAAAYAYTQNISNLITGVCQTDYSGYPDCRKSTMNSLQKTLNLGLEVNFQIHTPLMNLNKAQTVLLAQELNALPSLKYSHTCYEGKKPPCQKCPACELRAKGFKEAKIEDPLLKA